MKKRLTRTEGGFWLSAFICGPLWLISFILYLVLGAVLGVWIFAIIFFLVCAIPACLLCVIPNTYLKHWYIEFSTEGFHTNTLGRKRFFPWTIIANVDTEKSSGFTGHYDDILIITVDSKEYKYFLPHFGLHAKKETTTYTDAIKTSWKSHQN